MEEQPKMRPIDDATPVTARYEPPLAEAIEGPDPDTVAPLVTG